MLNMKKPLILWAALANILLLTQCSEQVKSASSSVSSASVWTSSSSSSSSSHSTSIVRGNKKPPYDDDRCGRNERMVDCLFGVCVPKTCDDVGFPVACPDLLPGASCPDGPGCICIENYVRNKQGICISMKKCPSCGGDENAVSGPGINPNRLCSNYNNSNLPCRCPDEGLYNACECKRGFVFDEIKRKCVKPGECSKLECKKPNQVYDPCPAPCPLRTCGINDAAVDCVPALSPGHPDCAPPKCRCKDGFYKDDKGQCVTLEECPTCPGVNEIYDPCPPQCPAQRCDVNPAVILCAVPPQLGDPECEPGCRCIDGYVRNYTGNVCIKREDCPICPQNEMYDICDTPCPLRRCDVDERLIKCAAPPKPGDPNCVEGCRCIDGYKRDYNGVCIPKEDCPICPQNEIYDICDTPCPLRRCDVDERLIKCAAPPKPGDPNCVEGCRCIDGYKRDSNGVCIPKEDCPKCTNPHEVYDPCPPTCPPQTCESINKTYHCPNQPVGNDGEIIQTCVGQCVCEPGYYRNKIGECISKENCLKCTGPHEYFSCGPACDNVCGLLKRQNQTNCPIVNVKCNDKCYCEEGYARDENNICVLIEDCKVPQCKKYEKYDACPAYLCQPLNCSQLGFPVPCPSYPDQAKCPGNPGCICVDGYVRDDKTGRCIRKEQCPSCGGDKNATSGCGVNCNTKCRDVGKKPGACIEVCYENECDCKDGYYMDENTDQCVKPEDCSPVCPVNEIYSECIQSLCSPKKCSELGFPVRCPRIDSKFCKKGCVCRDGKVRNSNGICVDRSECPSCRGDPNAKSGCGIYCNQRCSDIDTEPKACIALCYDNACDCKEGYYLDENSKKCVLPKDCPKPICNKNEYFNNCSNSDCSPQNCNVLGFPIQCTDIGDPSQCTEDCLCKEGYVRNNKGICVPSGECPSCGGDPNAISGCGGYCNQKCSDIGKEPQACILICFINSCDCREGYYYDEIKKLCVLPSDCTPQCPKNEYYNSCINGDCSVQNCKDVGLPLSPCPRIDPKYCKGGCLCDEGYARNEKGVCVPKNECPTCNGDPNQVSGCGVYCNQRCSDLGKEPGACILICYENSCDCREGYYLDESTGRCVKPWNCPPQCPENEYYSNCTNGDCSVQNCTDVGLPISCPQINSKYCKKGCLCNQGYARNAKGICVPLKECPTCKGDPNRVSGCGVYCNQKCSDIGLEPGFCIEVCYENDCDCREGYYLDAKTDKCVLPKDCNSCKNDPNRVPGCGVYCNQRCTDIGKEPGGCIAVCYDNSCDCKKGYFLDENIDKCVKSNNCTPVCSDNEVYSECINGGCDPKNCSQLGKDVPCVKLDPKNCIKGCLCKKGYLRAKNGICVPESECNPNLCPRPNEEYNSCFYNCPPQTCDSLDQVYACPIKEGNNCKAQCVCKQGYYRNKIGDCISEADCRKCMGPHEYFSCGGACDNVCATMKKQNQTKCPIVNIKCNDMCYCEKNYARAMNKTCIPIDKCNEPQCGVNEKYVKCPQKLGGPFTCSQLGYPVKDNSKKKCDKPACVCIDGYVRDSNKVCIPKADCPKLCPRPNEEYNPCFNNCPPQTCESLDRVYACPIREGDNCKAQCVCKQGYYRNKIGDCISEVNCRKCMGPHEYFSCGGACDNVCATMKKQNQTKCPIVNIKCNDMCYCEKNYARAMNKTCIPIDKCNEPQCGVNEKYVKCPQKLRGPFTCSQLGYPVRDNSKKKCDKPGCVCIDGYVRDSNKVCIPKTDCPSCRGDKNAVSGCGNCIALCEDLADDEPRICTQICYENACDCRDGYYYDKKLKKCVLPGECTSICKNDNEYYENCVNPRCRANTCDELGFPLNCSNNSSDCKKGCYCKDDLVRNKKGKCVPVKDCPSCGGDVNAQSGCGVNCLKHCYDLAYPKKPRPCPKICKINACDCKDGFYLDENINQCVKAKECSPICGKDEVYDPCTNGGCEFRNCSQIGGQQICIDPIECIKGCKCKQDYLRAKNGTCIPIEKCPEAKCPKRERFEKCPAALCLPQTCDDLGIEVPCLPTDGGFCPGGPGCICEDGYVRKNGKCIPKRNCPSCGGDPNAWSGCGVNCGKHCDDVFNKTRPCPRICYPNSCDCKDGFYFNDITGKCVKSSDCPPPCPENEARDFCVNGYCGIRNCSQANGPILCVDPIECEVGCTCVDGYLREDDTGVCVPECECPTPPEKCNTPKCVTCINNCTEGPPVNETTAIKNFELGNDLLNREFLYQLVKGRSGESFMFSVFSVLIALAQLALYATGAALDQLLRLLNLKSKDEIRTVFPILIKNYEAQTSVKFELAIKVYGSDVHPLTPKFINEASIFNSEVQSINFAKNVEAANAINDWVLNRTNNMIDDLVDPSMFSEATRMVLVNALYFLGNWVYQFNPNETTPQNFYYGKSDSDVLSLPTMCQQKRFLYAESKELDCQILRLPYKGQNFTFEIYLPRTRDGLGTMIEKMRYTDNIFSKIRESLTYQDVRVCIPKMDVETDLSNLTELLKMANLTTVFDPNSDGFECIFEDKSSVYISDAIQKSKIKVDETGTEAAVATAVVLTYRSLQPTSVRTFNADHPFLFIIKLLDSIVFTGVFYK